ncbi:MAG: 2-hydroxyacid dehydrogenase [Pseudomonadota bacterium]|nr:2-hydroxyacid dehydrogenase [Pseudomonadota bacterium]
MPKVKVAVIGDHFMKPEVFAAALKQLPGAGLDIRTLELDWPDTPMVHGYAAGLPEALRGLREFLGEPDEIVAFIGDAEVLVTHLAPVSGPILDRLPNLKLIAVSRGGPVNIDIQAARARGIPVVNCPGSNSSAVAEFTIGMILAETRLITRGHRGLAHGVWRGDLYRADRTGEELCRMTVGLIGYGHIGTQVVRLLKPFGCRILVADPYVKISDLDAADGVEQVNLEALLRRSDVVSLHARVTKETTGFIAAPQFAMMKDGAYFINTARGPMVNYDDLYNALASGKLRGAGLETFAVEPVPPDWPLLRLDNVTLTPHIAGASVKTTTYRAQMIAEEVRRYLAREAPCNPC